MTATGQARELPTATSTGLRVAITLVALFGMIVAPMVLVVLSIQATGFTFMGSGPDPERIEAGKNLRVAAGCSAFFWAIAVWILTGIRALHSSRNYWEIFLSGLAVLALLIAVGLLAFTA